VASARGSQVLAILTRSALARRRSASRTYRSWPTWAFKGTCAASSRPRAVLIGPVTIAEWGPSPNRGPSSAGCGTSGGSGGLLVVGLGDVRQSSALGASEGRAHPLRTHVGKCTISSGPPRKSSHETCCSSGREQASPNTSTTRSRLSMIADAPSSVKRQSGSVSQVVKHRKGCDQGPTGQGGGTLAAPTGTAASGSGSTWVVTEAASGAVVVLPGGRALVETSPAAGNSSPAWALPVLSVVALPSSPSCQR
jgi:hypothetical protein